MASAGEQETTNILLDTEDWETGYVRLTTGNTELEDYIQLTVSSEDKEVSQVSVTLTLNLSLGCVQRNHISL